MTAPSLNLYLMSALNFGPDDLEANRNGAVGPRQEAFHQQQAARMRKGVMRVMALLPVLGAAAVLRQVARGDAKIAQEKRTPAWQLFLYSLAFAAGAALLLFAGLFFPEGMTLRLPWVVALLFDLVGPLGVIAILALASLGTFAAAVRRLFSRG